jgi:hypothetical protein
LEKKQKQKKKKDNDDDRLFNFTSSARLPLGDVAKWAFFTLPGCLATLTSIIHCPFLGSRAAISYKREKNNAELS